MFGYPVVLDTFLRAFLRIFEAFRVKEKRLMFYHKPLILRLLQTGLEPVQSIRPGDFKSPASTIPPL